MFQSHRTATFIVASIITVAATSATIADEAADSVYVQRMMSLDKNDNGLLESSELPLPLRKRLQQIDTNKDQRISVQELVAHEQQTLRARAGMSPANSEAIAAADRKRVQVPTDFHQILKFALSFDRDGDGGLNATELKRYASVLAVQHRAARTQQTDVGDAAYDYEGPISRPGKMSAQPPPPAPAAAKAKGLGADGRGDGGFGDEP